MHYKKNPNTEALWSSYKLDVDSTCSLVLWTEIKINQYIPIAPTTSKAQRS